MPPEKPARTDVTVVLFRQAPRDSMADLRAAGLVERIGHDRIDADAPMVIAGIFVVHAHDFRAIPKDAKGGLGCLLREVTAEDGQEHFVEEVA